MASCPQTGVPHAVQTHQTLTHWLLWSLREVADLEVPANPDFHGRDMLPSDGDEMRTSVFNRLNNPEVTQ